MMINNNTPNANAKFSRLPKSLLPTPPAMSLIAAGTSVTPITVTTDPVTTGGNSFTSFPNNFAKITTNNPAAIIAP
ncbi:Uncharacterised protein [Streptococcus pneumoniae]|nr:Uncharacterised protein [Streptococcus pneumoniae]CJD56378.1 Uncharacterised protein [Streptococcus pneumoniae]